jgi:hypothetical protein
VALASLVKHLYKIVLVHQNAMMMARFLVAGATHQVAVIGLWVTDTGTIAGYKRIVTQAIAEQLTTSAQIQQMGQLHVLAATCCVKWADEGNGVLARYKSSARKLL